MSPPQRRNCMVWPVQPTALPSKFYMPNIALESAKKRYGVPILITKTITLDLFPDMQSKRSLGQQTVSKTPTHHNFGPVSSKNAVTKVRSFVLKPFFQTHFANIVNDTPTASNSALRSAETAWPGVFDRRLSRADCAVSRCRLFAVEPARKRLELRLELLGHGRANAPFIRTHTILINNIVK